MQATHQQNRIANAPIRARVALPMLAHETVATLSKTRTDIPHRRNILITALMAGLCLLASAVLPSVSRAQAPVFVLPPRGSTVKFFVDASVDIAGSFDKWDATLKFTSPDVATGVLDIKVQAASVNTGSGMKNNKLRSRAFFDARNNPVIRFLSTQIVQTGPNTFDVDGNFTIRGVTRPEKLTLTVSGAGTGSGTITGTMAFDRKDYGMNSGIPFIRIADRVEVTVDLKVKRVSGSPVALKQ
jgi:polyisoprenoid-binding protein YceI